MDQKEGANSFLVNAEDDGVHLLATTPRSDDTDDTNSSYDDGPAETGGTRIFPSVENRLYVINRAGSGEASYLVLTSEFDAILSYRVHTEKWRPIDGVIDFGVVTLGKYIYVIGGFHKGKATCLNRLDRYDACEGVWTECKSMIQARSKFGTCASQGKIFVCGGERSDGKLTASCEVYDPQEDTWSKCGMLLAPRSNPACAAYGKEIICVGGFHAGEAQNNLWLYERHQWQEMDEHYPHTLPYNLHKCAVATVGNTFYFIGGVSSHQTDDKKGSRKSNQNNYNNMDNFQLNHSKNSTHTTGKTNAGGGQTKNNKTIANGNNNNSSSSIGSGNSSRKASNPEKADAFTQFYTERRAFSYCTQISARDATGGGPQLDFISPWNLKLPPMIHPRHSAGAVAIGNNIHVVGGMSVETGQAVKVSEHFNMVTGVWEEDFTLRKCDMSNVCCVLLEVPKVAISDRKVSYRLRWVMW